MITIRIITNREEHCIEVISRGHALYDAPGYDIVCAAVSALMINTANSIEQLTENELTVDEDQQEDGYLRIAIPSDSTDDAFLLMDSLRLGLTSVALSYGEDYLAIQQITM